MFKKITLVIALVISINMTAQDSTINNNSSTAKSNSSFDFSKVQFGIKLSPTIAWVDAQSSELTSDGATLKFGIGCVASYSLLPNLSFVSGLNYNGFGGYVYDSESLSNTTYETSYKVNYTQIEIPFALKLQTIELKETSFFLQAGLSIGFLNKAQEKRIPIDEDMSATYTDIETISNMTRLAYQFGAGIEYPIWKKSNIFGLVTFNNSLSNSANSNKYMENRYTKPVQIFPGSMEFSFGIMF